jgi:CBS domain-containing protein
MKISVLLEKKGRAVVTVKPNATVDHVIALLRQHRIGCVVVSHDNKNVDGIVAVRDIVYWVAANAERLRTAKGPEILASPITLIMTHEVHCCSPGDTLRHVMAEMTKRHILHVPVVDKEALCGIVSIDDVVKYAIDEMDLEKSVLQDSVMVLRTLDQMR